MFTRGYPTVSQCELQYHSEQRYIESVEEMLRHNGMSIKWIFFEAQKIVRFESTPSCRCGGCRCPMTGPRFFSRKLRNFNMFQPLMTWTAQGLSMVMWATDVLHHIHPTTISLVAVLILFCPATGLMLGTKTGWASSFSFMPYTLW